MIVCLYNESDKVWSHKEQEKKLDFLTFSLKERILTYQDPKDRQLRIMGKLLLKELLQQFQLSDRIGLSNIQYTQYNRPFFDSEFEFSTSHSGEISVCAGTINAKVGIDLEQIRQVNVKDYKELFTDREWKMIKESKDINRSFYTLWTRKEACLKAIGTGVAVSFASIDVCSDIVTHEGYEYYLHELKIKEGYIAYLASNINPLKITIQMFNT